MAKTARTRCIDAIKARIEDVAAIAFVGEPAMDWPAISETLGDKDYVAMIAVTDDVNEENQNTNRGPGWVFDLSVVILLPDLTGEAPPVPYYENGADICRLVYEAVMGTKALRGPTPGLWWKVDCSAGGGVGFFQDPTFGEAVATGIEFNVHYRHEWDDPEVAF